MKRIFIGDLHGDWNVLNNIFQKYKTENLIQVGDLGLGFPEMINVHTGKPFAKDPEILPDRFKFIRGNHDNPEVCKRYPNYLGDYGVDEETGMFYISGAWSIDVGLRTPGVDWWRDEELDYSELQKAIELYEKTKPNVVLSHTCPAIIANFLIPTPHGSRTENALETMFKIHRPKTWLFGHWHIVWRKDILGTDFICLAPNARISLDV